MGWLVGVLGDIWAAQERGRSWPTQKRQGGTRGNNPHLWCSPLYALRQFQGEALG